MKHTRISRSYIFLLSCMLFDSSQVLPVAESDLNGDEPSINQSQGLSYVCFDKSMSNIADVIAEISALDTDVNSPLSQLKHHIDNGYMLGLRDEVLDVLEYAEWFVARHTNEDIKRLVAPQLDKVIEQVLKGELDISEQEIMRSSDLRLIINSKARFKEDVRMDKKLYVHGKTHFDKDVEFKDDVKIKDDLTINGNLIVNGSFSAQDTTIANLTASNANIDNHNLGSANITGELSAADAIIACDLSVGCNISMVDSTDSGHGNIFKGSQKFIHNIGTDNTFVGSSAGNSITTGSNNTAIGSQSLANLTNGTKNVAVGSEALLQNNGGQNVAVGYQSLTKSGISIRNVAIGSEAGSSLTTGDNNTLIGYNAGNLLVNADSNIYIGTSVNGTAFESNTIRIGNNNQFSTHVAGIHGKSVDAGTSMTVIVDSTGKLGTVPSSKRFKHNIESMRNKSERIYDLNPVEFVYNQDASETKHYGLIAEEVAQVFPELVINEQDGTPFTVRYEVLPVLLLNEIQKQQQKMDAITQKVEKIDEINDKIATMNEALTFLKQQMQDIIVSQ